MSENNDNSRQNHQQEKSQKKIKRDLGWSYSEEQQLCKSYLEFSSDPSSSTFWEDIKAYFDREIDPNKKKQERSIHSMETHWRTINDRVSKFHHCYETVAGGVRPDDDPNFTRTYVDALSLYCNKRYRNSMNFRLGHCWYLLYKDERWKPIIEKEKRATPTPSSSRVIPSSSDTISRSITSDENNSSSELVPSSSNTTEDLSSLEITPSSPSALEIASSSIDTSLCPSAPKDSHPTETSPCSYTPENVSPSEPPSAPTDSRDSRKREYEELENSNRMFAELEKLGITNETVMNDMECLNMDTSTIADDVSRKYFELVQERARKRRNILNRVMAEFDHNVKEKEAQVEADDTIVEESHTIASEDSDVNED